MTILWMGLFRSNDRLLQGSFNGQGKFRFFSDKKIIMVTETGKLASEKGGIFKFQNRSFGACRLMS